MGDPGAAVAFVARPALDPHAYGYRPEMRHNLGGHHEAVLHPLFLYVHSDPGPSRSLSKEIKEDGSITITVSAPVQPSHVAPQWAPDLQGSNPSSQAKNPSPLGKNSSSRNSSRSLHLRG